MSESRDPRITSRALRARLGAPAPMVPSAVVGEADYVRCPRCHALTRRLTVARGLVLLRCESRVGGEDCGQHFLAHAADGVAYTMALSSEEVHLVALRSAEGVPLRSIYQELGRFHARTG